MNPTLKSLKFRHMMCQLERLGMEGYRLAITAKILVKEKFKVLYAVMDGMNIKAWAWPPGIIYDVGSLMLALNAFVAGVEHGEYRVARIRVVDGIVVFIGRRIDERRAEVLMYGVKLGNAPVYHT